MIDDALLLSSLRSTISGGQPPRCPECGSDLGQLGTQAAYFICHNEPCLQTDHNGNRVGSIRYWVDDPHTWREAVIASPFGRVRDLHPWPTSEEYEAAVARRRISA